MNSIAPIVLRCILAVVLVTGGLPALGSGGLDSNHASPAPADAQLETVPAPVQHDVNDGGTAKSGEDCTDHGADSQMPSSVSDCMAGSGECCTEDCAKPCTTLAMVAVALGAEITAPTARRLFASSPLPASRTLETPLRPPQL